MASLEGADADPSFEDDTFGCLIADDHHDGGQTALASLIDEAANPQQARPSGGGLTEYEIRSESEAFRKIGYLEAYDGVKEERLQDGFEWGYRESISTAETVGRALGEMVALGTIVGKASGEEPPTSKDWERATSAAGLVRKFPDEPIGGADERWEGLDKLGTDLESLFQQTKRNTECNR